MVAAFTVPTLITGPVIGAYLDQLKAKRALFAANQVTLAAALTGVAVLAGRAPGTVLLVLGLLAGLTAPVLTGGFSSLVPLLVPPGGLRRANALDAASYNVAGLAGPALVAALAGAAGAGLALSAVAAIATLGLVLVLVLPMPAPAGPGRRSGARSHGPGQAPAGQEVPRSLRAAVADGLRLLRDVPLLRSTTTATTLSQLSQGLLPVTLPLLAVRLGHPASAGAWLLTAISGGGLAVLRPASGRAAGQAQRPGRAGDRGAGGVRGVPGCAGRGPGASASHWAWPFWPGQPTGPSWPRPSPSASGPSRRTATPRRPPPPRVSRPGPTLSARPSPASSPEP